MFMFHMWLPKAHVEAPVVGSMVLAAILLKLGGFGLIRLMPLLYSPDLQHITMAISLTGSGIIGLSCLQNQDIKVTIAYSSVAHMGLVIGRCGAGTAVGVKAAVVVILSHGVSSSLIFLQRHIIYLRAGTRNTLLISGQSQ